MNVSELFISKELSIKDSLAILDQTAKRILLVMEDEKLQGIITDGDIRRWILNNGDLNECVELAMNPSPISVHEKDIKRAKDILNNKKIEAIPVLNDDDNVVDIVFWNENFNRKLNYYNKLETPVVIMAGGKGTRLLPYTKILPKPLIPIGDTPIVERIINKFNEYGCHNYYMTVNYKKNMIKAYFDEKEKPYKVSFVEEKTPLGTAGSLYLLKDSIKETFFVSNCDILIEGNYSGMLKYHKANHNKITLISSLKHYTIPYGVIEIDKNSVVKGMMEKPEYDYLVNTGMYILEPECLEDIPANTFYHMTDLIEHYIDKGEKVGVYPVRENSWLDMGQFKEMENMIERLGVSND